MTIFAPGTYGEATYGDAVYGDLTRPRAVLPTRITGSTPITLIAGNTGHTTSVTGSTPITFIAGSTNVQSLVAEGA